MKKTIVIKTYTHVYTCKSCKAHYQAIGAEKENIIKGYIYDLRKAKIWNCQECIEYLVNNINNLRRTKCK